MNNSYKIAIILLTLLETINTIVNALQNSIYENKTNNIYVTNLHCHLINRYA